MTLLNQTLQTNVTILLSSFPGARDGNADAIHDGRVATRRLRAVVPLACAGDDNAAAERVLQLLRKAGGALGRARDTDVVLEQLDALQRKLRAAPIAIGALLHRVRQCQLEERRRLVRKIDRLDFSPLTLFADRCGRRATRGNAHFAVLERAVAEQVQQLHAAVTAGSGVYFPKRAHRVRIDAKKLRYELELVPHPGVKRAVKSLRRAQEILGSIQDRRAVIDALSEIRDIPEREREAVLAMMTAESLDLHRQYLEMRGNLLQCLEDVARQAATGAWRPRIAPRLLALGAFAGPTLVALLARRAVSHQRAKGSRSDREGIARTAPPAASAPPPIQQPDVELVPAMARAVRPANVSRGD